MEIFYNSRCVWNPGLVWTGKDDFACCVCIRSSSYNRVVVEIGMKGRGLVIVHAHSLGHVIICDNLMVFGGNPDWNCLSDLLHS